MNVGVSVNNQIIGVLLKMIICGILARVICKCNKAFKIDEYLDIKNCSSEKRLISKLVLECGDEVKSEMIKSSMCNSYYFIDNYMLAIISCHLCQLLSLSSNYRPKQKHLLLFNGTVIKLGKAKKLKMYHKNGG